MLNLHPGGRCPSALWGESPQNKARLPGPWKNSEKKTPVFSFYLVISFHRFTVDEWYLSTIINSYCHYSNVFRKADRRPFLLVPSKAKYKAFIMWVHFQIHIAVTPDKGPHKASLNHSAAIAAAGAVSSPLADLANEHFSLLTTKKKPLPPDPVAPPHISAGKKFGFLFGFTCFLFSRRYHNIEESNQVFFWRKSLAYWIPDNMSFFECFQWRREPPIFDASVFAGCVLIMFHENEVSGNSVIANIRMIPSS